jgi:sec-independent protein translocase protein TatA
MNTLLFLGLGGQEILIIALVVLLFFGGRKIPEMMRGLGKGVKSFKEGMNGTEDDVKKGDKKEETTSEPEKE